MPMPLASGSATVLTQSPTGWPCARRAWKGRDRRSDAVQSSPDCVSVPNCDPMVRGRLADTDACGVCLRKRVVACARASFRVLCLDAATSR